MTTEQAGVWLDADEVARLRDALWNAHQSSTDGNARHSIRVGMSILDAAEARSAGEWETLEDGALVVRNRAGGDILIDDSLWVHHLVITKLGEFSGSAFVPKENMRNVALAILHLATAAGTGGEGE